MTEDEKHELRLARLEEAARRWGDMSADERYAVRKKWFYEPIAYLTAQLTEEDWRPEPAVDPDLIEARTCARLAFETLHPFADGSDYELGVHDNSVSVQSALIAIKRAKEGK